MKGSDGLNNLVLFIAKRKVTDTSVEYTLTLLSISSRLSSDGKIEVIAIVVNLE